MDIATADSAMLPGIRVCNQGAFWLAPLGPGVYRRLGWAALPLEQRRLPCGDYKFTLKLAPVSHRQ